MKISIITLFPKMVECFIQESIVRRAQEKKLVEIEIINLRDFAKDKYRKVDDRPYGGGAGMILMAEPIYEAIKKVTSYKLQVTKKKSKFQIPNSKQILNSRSQLTNQQLIVLTSPRGRVYNQTIAQNYYKLDQLIIIAGHYEGVDERVNRHIDEEISLGDFIMTGGEITAAAIIDSVVRLIPGVLKKIEAVENESFFKIALDKVIDAVGLNPALQKMQKKGKQDVCLLEYPQYTRPEIFMNISIPEVLMSGNHKDIDKWRIKKAFEITLLKRPDLLEL